MPPTLETSGGSVEHEIYMMEGIILLVFELKLEYKNEMDSIAQVLLELACESHHWHDQYLFSEYKANNK
jgi:hypothetical protein